MEVKELWEDRLSLDNIFCQKTINSVETTLQINNFQIIKSQDRQSVRNIEKLHWLCCQINDVVVHMGQNLIMVLSIHNPKIGPITEECFTFVNLNIF